MKHLCLAIAVASFTLSISAPSYAQYVWVDKNNVKHYSDQPPSASEPGNRILKAPRGQATTPQSGSAGTSDASAASAAPKDQKPMTSAEKNADFKKRNAEKAEKEKKAEDARKLAADKAANCKRAKDYKRTLDSGQRIVKTDKSGEQRFLNDDERAEESRSANQAVGACQ